MQDRVLIGGVSLLLLTVPTSVLASLVDDFEDGDYTTDPTWTVNPETPFGDTQVVTDPLRPPNLVLAGYGTETGHRLLETPLSPTPWANFGVAAEMLTLNGDVSLAVGVSWGVAGDLPDPYYSFGFRIQREPGWTTTLLHAREYYGDRTIFVDYEAYFDEDPTGSWWHFHAWYDQPSQLVRMEVRSADDASLIFDHAFAPFSDPTTWPSFDHAIIGFEETSWSYLDNIWVIPEPSTVLLLVVGALLPLRRGPRK